MIGPWFPFALALMALSSYVDNARGPLLPELSRVLAIPYGQAAWLFAGGNLAALGVSFLLLRASKKWNEEKLTVIALLSIVVAAAFPMVVKGFPTFLVLAALLGSAVYAVGAMSNLWVMRHAPAARRGNLFCGLHTMYGMAGLLAPLSVEYVFSYTRDWRAPFALAIPIALGLLAVLWRMKPHPHEPEPPLEKPHSSRAQAFWVGTMCIYVAGEVLVASWMVAFLVSTYKMPLAQAAPYLTGFFLCMGITRGLCWFLLTERWERTVLVLCVIGALTLVALGHFVSPRFLPFAGIMGPFFPVFLSRTARRFPGAGKSMTQLLLLGMQGILVVAHLSVGWLADRFGVSAAYWTPAFCFVAVLLALPCLEGNVTFLRRPAWRNR